MGDATDLGAAVRGLVAARAALAGDGAGLADETSLGEGGLGMDSIALVELLLDCERRFGIPRPAALLAGPPLTVGRLAELARAAAVAR